MKTATVTSEKRNTAQIGARKSVDAVAAVIAPTMLAKAIRNMGET
jgi:hypothetical protein